jgi:hypothetical protein
MKKLLFQLDTDPIPSVFDTVVAYDGGADHVTPHGGVNPQNVGGLVDGAIFTRSPKEKKNTALFVGGSNLEDGQNLLTAVKKKFFADFRVSVMLDSNGSNTTAAAGVACLTKHGALSGKRAVVLAGTGPVGQRAGIMLAQEGAQVILTSRKLDRAETACQLMQERFKVNMIPMAASDEASTRQALDGAHIVFSAGAGGIQLMSEAMWKDHPTLQLLVDANATPPLGIEGVDMLDRGKERHGKIVYGAIGFGAFKLTLHRACIGRLFDSNNQVFDAEEIFAFAKTLV